jgi:CubicO group peptidase (beta-lactamase class C family)
MAVCALSICCAGAVGDELAQKVEAVVPAGFSGQIVIGNPGGVLYRGNFGLADREASIPVDADTVFDIGSITKTFTATAILKLAVQGKLSPEQTLADWFDPLPKVTGQITLHQLLTHSSGLPLYSGDDDEPCDRDCFDAWLAKTEPEFPPGERYQYSNPGYSALARIIEKVSGRDYEQYLNEALVAPLELGPVGYRRLPADARYAVGYYQGERVGKPPDMVWAADGPPWHLRGNGGLICSASTLFRWLQATAAGRTLPREWQTRQLTGYYQRREGVQYGYGWSVLEKPWGEVIDHTGGNGFFFADARWFRDDDMLFAITNNAFDRGQIQSLVAGLREVLGKVED